MDFTYLFTSLQGRINRAKWWAGEAILFLVFSATALIGNQTMVGRAISALIWIILYLPAYPLAAKRFQDRDKPGETALYAYILSIIAAGLLSFGPVQGKSPDARTPIQRRRGFLELEYQHAWLDLFRHIDRRHYLVLDRTRDA